MKSHCMKHARQSLGIHAGSLKTKVLLTGFFLLFTALAPRSAVASTVLDDSFLKDLCVEGDDSLLVPNIFSPNNDGVNDLFRVSGVDLISLQMVIFNVRGQQVAILERVAQSWDGRSPAGEMLSAGTYFYTLQATSINGRTFDLVGSVTLVR